MSAMMTPERLRCTLITRLQGGIGNQLFQILFSQKLARMTGSAQSFDPQAYAFDTYGRQPMVQRIMPEARLQSLQSLAPADVVRMLREQDLVLPADGGLVAQFALPPEVTHLVLDGYWQDSRLIDVADVARLRDTLQQTLEPSHTPWAARIRSATHSVAVHLRRQDYRHHGLCKDAYYLDALRWLTLRVDPPGGALDVFVFTDEPNSTAYMLNAAGIRHTLVRSGDDLADLYLMSLCQRHVISNSSFSWWGAMLGGGQDVIYPTPWSQIHAPSAQLWPSSWRCFPDAVELPTGNAAAMEALDKEQRRIDQARD
jgi:hypothetical protein